MINQDPLEHRSLFEDSDRENHTHHHVDTDDDTVPHIAWRIGAAMYSFVVLGLYTSSIGVMLHPVSQHYSLSDVHVSLIFIVGPVGYIIAAQSSDFVHCTLGQRGIAVLAPALQILGALAIASHPPFGLVLVGFAAVALGGGFLDGSWCAWAANVGSANTATGLLQGAFSIGAAVGPFFAGTVLPAWERRWYDWYYILAVVSAVELCVLFAAFKQEDGQRYREQHHDEAISTNGKFDRRAMFKHLATWLTSLYFLAYVGSESAISGWIVSFMLRYRNASPDVASLASSGFWGGMAVGRFVLGVATDKLGVGRATKAYFVIAIALQIVFAFLHASVPSVVLMTFIGFFMGPMFASGVVILTRLLPAELHVAAVSFTASVGQVGGALLPFGIGAVIQGLGIGAFRYAIVVLLAVALLSWIPVSQIRPKISSSSRYDEESEEDGVTEPLLRQD